VLQDTCATVWTDGIMLTLLVLGGLDGITAWRRPSYIVVWTSLIIDCQSLLVPGVVVNQSSRSAA